MKFFAVGLALLMPMAAATVAEAPPRMIEQAELDTYWVLAPELMGSVLPPIARGTYETIKQRGKIVLIYDLTIDARGVPTAVELKSIEPADVDPRPFIANVMFKRYKPGAGNPERQAIRVTIRTPHWIPKG